MSTERSELVQALADTVDSPEAFDAALADLMAAHSNASDLVAEAHEICRRCGLAKPASEYRRGRRTCKSCETTQAAGRRRPDHLAGLVRSLAALEADVDARIAADTVTETLAASYAAEHTRDLDRYTARTRHKVEALTAELERCAAAGTIVGPELATAAAQLLARIRNHHDNHAARAAHRDAAHPMRTCSNCGRTKPISAYNIDRGRKDRRRARCAECDRDQARQRRQAG